ncbi:FtsK/SpoIIIE domain-containing protein [Radiobacillus sp. PE A8.2]|uniref:FtsK/SpoIIIE domain-containing protein n=1 Tax=Radiobacillus sp. PE A8.2 TaxID=3380349 RepID=UPI00388CF504
MSDRKKIQKIFEYTGIIGRSATDGTIKTCRFIRQDKIKTANGMEYVFRIPLGVPSKKIEMLNNDVGIFKDGLHKDVETEFKSGMLHVFVYEDQLPTKWLYTKLIPQLKPGTWKIPVGMTYKGLVWHDFDKIPHTVMGGTTRYGKTIGLKSIMTSLVLSNPDDVEFYIIDLKRKLEFGKYEKLEQVREVAGTPEEALKMLNGLKDRYDKVMDYFHDNDLSNIVETDIKKRIFVIVDEANRLVPKTRNDKIQLACQTILEDISSVSGGLGVRLIFCTQYPVGTTLPRDIKQNSDAKMSFRLQTGKASEVVLGDGNTHAAHLKDIPGRCVAVHGPNLLEMQVPLISDRVMKHLLQNWYRTKRKDVTDWRDESEGENIIEFIPSGGSK